MPTIYQRLEKVIQAANKAIIAELPLGRQFSELIYPRQFIADATRILGKARLSDALFVLENTKVTPALFNRIISSEYIFQNTGLILVKDANDLVEKMANVARKLGSDATKQDGFFLLCRRLKIRNADSVKGFVYELHRADSQVKNLDTIGEIIRIRNDHITDADVKLLGNIIEQCKNYSTPITRTPRLESWFRAAAEKSNTLHLVVPDKSLVGKDVYKFFDELMGKRVGLEITVIKHP